MWNVKIWYKWAYLQNINRLTDLENEFMITRGEELERRIDRKLGIDIYIVIFIVCSNITLSINQGYSSWLLIITIYLVIKYNIY